MNLRLNKISIAGFALVLSLPQISNAEISWHGFLTIGGALGDPDGLTNGRRQIAAFPRVRDDITFNQDSKLGLQLKSDLTEKLSATGQMIARGSEDYKVEMVWAYLTYQATDKLKIRAGRRRTPFYIYSDFLEIGYAYHLISPPQDAYQLPANSIDGFDFLYQGNLGGLNLDTQVYFGSSSSPLALGTDTLKVDIRNQYGIVFTANYDWLTLRASQHVAGKVTFDDTEAPGIRTLVNGVQGALSAVPDPLKPAVQSTLNNITADDIRFTFAEAAIKIDWNNLLIVAEGMELTPEAGYVANTKRSFVTAGYRFGNVMPHLTYTHSDDELVDLKSGIPNLPVPEIQALRAGLGILETRAGIDARDSYTAGIRWDFEPGAAFKFEYGIQDDKVNINASGKIYRFAVDMVF